MYPFDSCVGVSSGNIYSHNHNHMPTCYSIAAVVEFKLFNSTLISVTNNGMILYIQKLLHGQRFHITRSHLTCNVKNYKHRLRKGYTSVGLTQNNLRSMLYEVFTAVFHIYITLAGYPASLETLSPGLSPPPSLVPLSPLSYSSLPSTLPPSDYPASLRITAFPRYFLNLEA